MFMVPPRVVTKPMSIGLQRCMCCCSCPTRCFQRRIQATGNVSVVNARAHIESPQGVLSTPFDQAISSARRMPPHSIVMALQSATWLLTARKATAMGVEPSMGYETPSWQACLQVGQLAAGWLSLSMVSSAPAGAGSFATTEVAPCIASGSQEDSCNHRLTQHLHALRMLAHLSPAATTTCSLSLLSLLLTPHSIALPWLVPACAYRTSKRSVAEELFTRRLPVQDLCRALWAPQWTC
jgi:hypothetical protein